MQQLMTGVIFLLIPGIVMLNRPDFFVEGLWNSLNLIRVMGGLFLALFAAVAGSCLLAARNHNYKMMEKQNDQQTGPAGP